MKFGLLMESAQAHQKMAETHLEKLRAHTQDLDGVVREEIRRTLVEELHEFDRREQRGRRRRCSGMKRAAHLRGLLLSVVDRGTVDGHTRGLTHWVLPSAGEIAALRAPTRRAARERRASSNSSGGRIDWRHCGETARLCVRVDRGAPAYGEKADYYVVEGY